MTPSRRVRARLLLLALAAASAALAPAGTAQANSFRTPEGVSLPVPPTPPTDTTTPAGSFDLSSDGRLVAYSSNRPDAAPGVDTNQAWDLFVSDILATNASTRLPLVPGDQPNGDSFDPSISGDGRFVAFESRASNLVPDDTNGLQDVFVLDRDTDGNGVLDEAGKTSVTRVSVGAGGAQANGPSWSPSISDDGRTVAFASEATNLAPADGASNIDVYVRDRTAGTTTLVSSGSVATDSSWAPSLSRNGRFVAFTSTGRLGVAQALAGHMHVFLRDLQAGGPQLVSVTGAGVDACGTAGCYTTSVVRGAGGRVVSDDGSRVVFYSAGALNSVDTNGSVDAYLRDRTAGTTTLASIKPGGQVLAPEAPGNPVPQTPPTISGTGRLVAFTLATSPDAIDGLGDTHLLLYVRDTQDDLTDVDDFPGTGSGAPSLGITGQQVALNRIDSNNQLSVLRGSISLTNGGMQLVRHIPDGFSGPGGLRTALTTTLAQRGLPSSNAVTSSPIGSMNLQSTSVAHAGTLGQLGLAREHLSSITLGQLPLTRPGGWEGLLAGTSLGGVPAQSISLAELYAMPDRPAAVDAVKLDQVGIASSPLRDISLAAFALGGTPLRDIPIDGTGTDQKILTDWCTEIAKVGKTCSSLGIDPAAGSTDQHSLMSLDLGGVPLRDIPLRDIPLRDIDLSQSPLRDIPLRDITLAGSPLRDIPLRDIAVTGSPLRDIPLRDIPLRDIDANPSPLRDIPLRDIPLRDIDLVVDCTLVDCTTTGGKTLADAAAAGAIRPGATLDDLADVLGTFTLGDLHFYDDITLGQLAQFFPPGTTLGDLLTAIIPADGYPFESTSIASSGLQDASVAGTVDGSFETEINNGPAPLYISIDLIGNSLHYQPGSSSIDLGDGTTRQLPDPVDAGNGKLVYRFSMISGHVDLHYTLHGPIEFFTASAAEIIVNTQSFGPGNPTDVFVSNADTEEARNNSPDTAPAVQPNSVTASFLDHETDVDWYQVHVDQPGSRLLVTLSHLPTDGDLALYGPPGSSPTAFPQSGVPLSGQIVGDAGSGVTNQDQVLAPQVLQDVPIDPDLPLRSVSANRALDDEATGTVVDVAGDYRIAVSLYSGAQSSFNPYLLHVTVIPPPVFSCPARTFPHATPDPASLPASYPDALNTLFLVNTQRLAATFGQAGADQVQASVDNLVGYLNGSGQSALGVTAAVLPVDGSPEVRDQYAAWDQNPCSTAGANATVKSITGLLQSIRQDHPNLKYLVMVGGDDQIPLARIPDLTSLSNETDYASTFAADPDELFGSLATGDILSDDVYGDTAPFAGTDENRLFLPRIAVGRLVETPDQISGALDRFRDPTVRGALDATTGLVTGYDFLADGARSVASALQANLGAGSVDSSLIDPFGTTTPWTLSQLQAKVFPASGTSPDVLSLNGHYDHRRALPSAGNTTQDESDLFTTGDLAAHPVALAGRLVFTMGCHAGLQVPDVLLSSGDPLSNDWAESYAQQGALLAANTGYGLGDTNTVAYSERLMALFAKRLDGSLTIGQALAAAKADYYSSLGVIGVYDAKILQEAVFYGLPFYAVGQSPIAAPAARAAAAPAVQPNALPVDTDPVTGLTEARVTVDPSFTTNTARDGSVFYTVGAEAPQVTHYRPLQPKTIVDVTQPASVGLAHGALVTALTSSDQTKTVTVDRPTVDEAAAEPASAFGTVAFPSKLQTLATTTGPAGLQQTLVIVPGQFLSDGPLSAGRGTQRLYSHVAASVLYSNSPDFDPATVGATSATVVAGPAVKFSVNATAEGSIVKRVLVLYHDNDAAGTWRSVDLADDGSGTGTFTATAPLSAAVPAGSGVDYSVQVVDSAGNVAVAGGKSTGFVAPSPQTPGTVTVTAISPTNPPPAWFRAPVSLKMTHAGSTIQYRINGGALLPYNPAVPPRLDASGTYEVSAVADDGATGSAIFKLDLEAPTITPAKANLAFALNGFVGTPFSCADATSGIKTCAVTKPIAVNKEGTFTFTVQATDVAGNTASLVVPYIVDATAPKIALTIPDEGDTYKIGKNIIVRYTCNDPINKNVASGLVQCDGPLASGSKLDTSKLGTFSFTVTARDAVGHVSTNTHRYQITK